MKFKRRYMPNSLDHVALWWHCLTRVHCQMEFMKENALQWIGCFDCEGRPDIDSLMNEPPIKEMRDE